MLPGDLRSPRVRRWGWAAIFLGLFGLALDFWRWDLPPAFGPFGLPRWTLYFVGLQLLLAGAIAVLARTDWPGDPPAGGATDP